MVKEEFFAEEINEVLSVINDNYEEIFESLVRLHNMTGWTYGEIADKVSRNCDYYSLADVIRFCADGAEGVEWEMRLWDETGKFIDPSF